MRSDMNILIVASDRGMRHERGRMNFWNQMHPGARIDTVYYGGEVSGMRFDLVILTEPPKSDRDDRWTQEILAYRLKEHGAMIRTW